MSFSCAYSSSILSPSPSRLELGSVFARLLLTKPPVRRPKLVRGTETILNQMQCNVTFFFLVSGAENRSTNEKLLGAEWRGNKLVRG